MIFRKVKSQSSNVTLIDNEILHNPNISFASKGLIAYLLSKPEGWGFDVVDLVKISPHTIEEIDEMIRELKRNNFIE